jgi:hypothetical protein
VEPDIKSIKCTLGLKHLRGQSPESLHRELWTGVLTYNLVRLKMLQSGYSAGREIRSMSFTETHQSGLLAGIKRLSIITFFPQ